MSLRGPRTNYQLHVAPLLLVYLMADCEGLHNKLVTHTTFFASTIKMILTMFAIHPDHLQLRYVFCEHGGEASTPTLQRPPV